MKSLDEIGIACETDRASVFTRTFAKPHDYCRHYDKLFTPLRDKPVKLAEIGVGGGEGVRMWLEYGPKWDVYGVDIVHGTNPYDTPGADADTRYGFRRYTFRQGDQCDPEFWKRFIEAHGGDFDIICDDGLHSNIAVITTFNALWQHVKPGGFYCVEDLGVGYGGPSFFVKPEWPSQIDFLKGKIDELNLAGGIDSIYWAPELCIIKKATK